VSTCFFENRPGGIGAVSVSRRIPKSIGKRYSIKLHERANTGYEHPETIAEVKRILHLNLQTSKR
jgi:hypothetical protein